MLAFYNDLDQTNTQVCVTIGSDLSRQKREMGLVTITRTVAIS
jgi:hypothetical protein